MEFVCWIFLFHGLLFSQETDPVPFENSTKLTSLITELPGDYKEFGRQLVDPEEWRLLALTMGASAALYADDQDLWAAVSKTRRSASYKDFWFEVEKFNGGTFQIGTSAFFLSWGLLGDQRALRTSLQIGRGIISSGMIVQLMKRATGRESPNKQSEHRGKWQGYPGESKYRSDVARYDAVPSGHLQSAMVTFLVIAENYPEQKWIPWVGWPLMGIFSYSLVATDLHWWSDFPIAAYLAFRFSKIITRKNDLDKPLKADEVSWEIYPQVTPGGGSMLTFNLRF